MMNYPNVQEQAHQYLLQEDYEKAASLYEQAINNEPEAKVKYYYWYLGLILLLQGQEAEAQTTWLLGMADGDEEEVNVWITELLAILQTEAERQDTLPNDSKSWAIRQHIREISPTNINNLLHLILLSIKLEIYTGEELNDFHILQLLDSDNLEDLDCDLLMHVLEVILNYAPLHPQSLEFANVCLQYVTNKDTFINLLLLTSNKLASSEVRRPELAIKFSRILLGLEPENWDILRCLTTYYQLAGEDDQAIETAKKCYFLSNELSKKVFASHLIVKAWMNASGYLQEAMLALKEHESFLLSSLIKSPPENLDEATTVRLFSTTFFFPYARDQAEVNSYIRNQVARICQKNIDRYAESNIAKYRKKLSIDKKNNQSKNKRLKIGYISHCLKQHSVGWLARWLFEHHDKEKFSLCIYLVNSKQTKDDPLQNWYISQVQGAYQFASGTKSVDIGDRIYEDEIDVLVDLDSITLDVTPAIMALKPAPVQVTWLGWDASGVPGIDYFIADPYVLPENAQDYYSEKIWRLPQTYIAVDGFEVTVPTLRRDHLNIPNDAVVYLTSQRGYKYNHEMLWLQLKILTEVPNSYLLIKGIVEQKLVEEFIVQLAEEKGVSKERIIFLSGVPSSAIHRANLGIADVVLDTYPYNGATTTLETLWMCLPMVTRVGQQFSARNSYTMMINAGITEGIAWTDEDYVEWGIRLGKDEKLRQEISWKLRKSRQTAPLWNGKQFTREMEKAYEQMWQRYVDN